MSREVAVLVLSAILALGCAYGLKTGKSYIPRAGLYFRGAPDGLYWYGIAMWGGMALFGFVVALLFLQP
jgi:hypothetical protein